MKVFGKHSILFILVQLSCLLLLLWPALENGYPLLDSDSGTYIKSAHTHEIPIDRPLFYGLFVQLTSWSYSLWLTVIVQALLLNYLIYRLAGLYFDLRKAIYLQLFIILLVTFSSGAAVYTGIIMPDFFTPIAVLCFPLVLSDAISRQERVILYLLIIYSMLAHLSNFPLVLCLLISSVLILGIWARPILLKLKSRLYSLAACLLLAFLVLSTSHYMAGYGFRMSRASNVFIGARLIQSGIAEKHLRMHCGKEGFEADYVSLCNHLGTFHNWPTTGIYLFGENSPLFQDECKGMGWVKCWEIREEQYKELVGDILKEPTLYSDLAKMVAEGSYEQFTTYGMGYYDSFNWLEELIEKYYPRDLHWRLQAKQHETALVFPIIYATEKYVFYTSLLLLLLLLISHLKRLSFESKLLILTVLAALVFNAAITSTLSNVVPRYQGRLVFLVPMVLILEMIKYSTKQISRV